MKGTQVIRLCEEAVEQAIEEYLSRRFIAGVDVLWIKPLGRGQNFEIEAEFSAAERRDKA